MENNTINTPVNSSCTSQHKKTKKSYHKKSDAVKSLELIANKAVREKYPNTPPEWLAPRKYSDKTAKELIKCIIDFLRLKGHQAKRISNKGRWLSNQKKVTDVIGRQRTIGTGKWIKDSGSQSTEDISATINGKSIKIEINVGADRQSNAQRNYQQAVERAGGIYFIASSFEKFINWYNLL